MLGRDKTYIDNPAVLLLAKDGPGRLGASIRALNVYGLYSIPVLFCHGLKGLVSENASIVDEDLPR